MLNSDYMKTASGEISSMSVKQENLPVLRMDYQANFYNANDISNFEMGYKYDLDDDSYEFGDDEDELFAPRNKGGRKQVKVGTTKRNARERNRVRFINSCFEVLRDHIPFEIVNEKKNRKLSKVETLKYATLYIKQLSELLNNSENNSTIETASAPSTPSNSIAYTSNDSQPPPRKRIRSEEQSNVTKNDTNNNLVVNNININIYDNRLSNYVAVSSTNVNSNYVSNAESYPYSPTTSTSSMSSSSSSYYSPKYVDHYPFESSAGYNFYSSSNCCQPLINSQANMNRFVDARYFNHGSVFN